MPLIEKKRKWTDEELAEIQAKREERKALLTPEQLAIVQRWDAKRSVYERIFEQIGREGFSQSAVDEFNTVVQYECEHDRGLWEDCLACDAIELILNPELYEGEGYDDDEP